MSAISFKAPLHKPGKSEKIGSGLLLTLPKEASSKLSSRGMTIVEGTINDFRFRVPLEPDGQTSHWFGIDKAMQKAIGVDVGDTVTIEIEPAKVWPDPVVPKDLKKALAADLRAHAMWEDITPIARWDWIRWLDSVKLPETRKVRPDKLCSMLRSGKRRPCCFNRAMRTEPKSAELL